MSPAAGDGVPDSPRRRWPSIVVALLAGALSVFAFAPFGFGALAFVTLATLLGLWSRASRPRDAAWLGFAFGAGLFSAGISWVYVALETFGGMPAPLAFVSTAGLVAYLSIYPAAAGWVAVRFTDAGSLSRVVVAAATFVLAEWLRGYLLTGFPWLTFGYSQLPGSPLAGFAPMGGVWLVSLAIAAIAAAIVYAIDALESRRGRAAIACVVVSCVIAGAGAQIRTIEWTAPSGAPLAVSLVQGNVAQDLKFDPSFRARTFELYQGLAERARGALIVLPESTYPMFVDELPPEVVQGLADVAKARGAELLFGVFVIEPPEPGSNEPRVYNSVVSVGGERSGLYRKRHLVPFGETIPAKPLVGWVMNNLLAIPIGDQARGPAEQAPFPVAGERVAVNICYEDAFGSELRDGARGATLLVNVTNDAWYGRSIAARQHNQIAAMRALELGRPMLRATNTGITSAIDHDGRVVAELPWFTRDVLEVAVAGRRGETPYVRFGDATALALAAAVIALALLRRLKKR